MATAVRAHDKENPFAPAMVSQEARTTAGDSSAAAEAAPAVQSPIPRSRPARPRPPDGRGRKSRSAAAAAAAAGTAASRRERRTAASARDCRRREARGRAEAGACQKTRKADAKPAAQRRPSARRRQAPRRAPLPAAKRELLVSVDVTEKRVAVLEDGRVAEVYLERPERRSIAGNIYKGVVDNVLPGMEAAFVEIGLEKNGFLFVDEIVGPELEGRRPRGRRITDLISRGEEVLVQAVKDPMKTKGARLTTEISLPGRFVVYVPHGEGLGVSRRLEEDERNRLRDIVKEIAPKQGGVIVRTAAEGASADDVELDLEFLMKLWKQIQAQAKASKPPSAGLRGGRAAAARHARPLHRRLRAGARRRRQDAQAHPGLPEEDLAAHGRARLPLPGQGAAVRGVRRRRRDPLDALAPGRPAVGRLPDLRLRRGVHGHRRQHGPLRRLALEDLRGAARGHGHEEQPRGGEGGRPPAPPARHRRDHRHRLHRHGEPEEPGGGRAGAPAGARARPDEDVRRRDLPARARRDDAPERHRRPARDPHAQVPDLRRRRRRRLRGDRGRRRRAEAAGARRVEAAHEGLQGRAERARRRAPDRARRRTARARSRRRPGAGSSSSGRTGVAHEHFAVLDEGTVEKLAVDGAPVSEGQTLELKLVEVGRHDAGAGSRQGRRHGRSPSAARRSSSARRCQSASSACSTESRTRRSPTSRPSRRLPRRSPPRPRPRSRRAPRGRRRPRPTLRPSTSRPRSPRRTRSTSRTRWSSRRGAGGPRRGGRRGSRRSRAGTGVRRVRRGRAEEASRRGSRGGRGRKKKPAAGALAETNGSSDPEAVAEPDRAGVRGRAEAELEPEAAEQPSPDGDTPPKKKTRRGSRGGRGRKKRRRGGRDERPAASPPRGAGARRSMCPDAGLGGGRSGPRCERRRAGRPAEEDAPRLARRPPPPQARRRDRRGGARGRVRAGSDES